MGRHISIVPRHAPTGGFGAFSPINAPSTTVYSPDTSAYSWATRSGFRFTPPEVFLDSTWNRAGIVGSSPISFTVTTTLSDSGDPTVNTTTLQAAIDAASTRNGHTLIYLPSGWVCNKVRLRKHTLGAWWTYIAWNGIDAVQPEGTRGNNQTVATTHANAPQIRSNTTGSTGAVWCDMGADYTRLAGIHFVASASARCFRLVYFQGTPNDSSEQADTSVNDTPQWMIVDRCWIDGQNIDRVVNGIICNSREFACVDSVINGCYALGQEGHGINGYNGPGPWKIVGNDIEAAAINFLCGGLVPRIVGLQTTDIEVRRNYFYKRASWNRNDPLVWDGIGSKVIKNLFELKWGDRVLVEGNVFENSFYGDNQKGAYLVWKVENSVDPLNPPPGGGNITATTANVTYRHNIAYNCAGGYEFQGVGFGGTVGEPLHNVQHYNNANIRMFGDRVQFRDQSTGSRSSGRGMFFNNGAHDIYVEHDSIVLTTGESTDVWATPIQFSGPTDEASIFLNDNILAWPIASPPHDADSRSIFGDGAQVVGPPDNGTNTLIAYCGGATGPTTWTFDKNVMVRTYVNQVNPPGSSYTNLIASVGFVNVDNDDIRLAPSSTYKGLCDDGSDPGCDLDLILFATAGVRAP